MEISVYGIALIPLILGLVQLAKNFKFPTQFLPLLSLGLGILFGVVFAAPDDWRKGIIVGIWLGLGATGMHSGIKNTVNGTFRNGNGKTNGTPPHD
jgi:hypothetical protein